MFRPIIHNLDKGMLGFKECQEYNDHISKEQNYKDMILYQKWKYRAQELLERVTVIQCTECQASKDLDFYPAHFASNSCESGKRNHCTCDTCF